jgi:hypothetical protein
MKRLFAIALLLMSFASAALADGPGQKPPGNATSLHQTAVVLLTDGSGQKPPGNATSLHQTAVVRLADGSGQIPPGNAQPQGTVAA